MNSNSPGIRGEVYTYVGHKRMLMPTSPSVRRDFNISLAREFDSAFGRTRCLHRPRAGKPVLRYDLQAMNETPPVTLDCQPAAAPQLIRTMGLFALVVYGVGDMVGAGIYATIGQAAGRLGNAVWLAFVVSMVAALLTGMSYASISSRYPRAAGAAYVTNRAFRRPFLSYLVGLAVCASGMTSMATSSNAFANAFHKLIDPGARHPWLPWAMLVGFLVAITLLNLWGIRESLWGNLVCTAVEIGGLL